MKNTLIWFAILVAMCNNSMAQKITKTYSGARVKKIKTQIDSVGKLYKATIGVAVISLEDRDTLTINNAHHFPMQSVYKFPLAIAVLNEVDKHKLSLGQKIHVTKKDLRPDTWSPLREKYHDGNVDLSLGDIISYTVSKSDNNGCDILFRLMKGTAPVNKYIHSIGISDISIAATEEEMATGWNVQYTNWSTPFAMAQLLEGFYHQKYLSAASSDFLMQVMIKTETGLDRLRGQLPAGTEVADKTGTSNTNEKGMMAATNDVGIITLPNGKHIAIVVFVSDTMESSETNKKIIATIARSVYDYFASL